MHDALWRSFKKNYPGLLFEQTFWNAARTFSKSEFGTQKKVLAKAPMPAVNEFRQVTKYKWSKHHFGTYSKNHYNTNNLSESFNAWILEARKLLVVDLVDKIWKKITEKFEKIRKLHDRWK